ncbi:hypothetical protein [Nostoc sp.]|uniref:hypothetical protein n=1 Tax=Nostoc sp. TaxID=1180 RepID=UPI002FF9F069
MFSQSFKPALNKDGYARLTFANYQIQSEYSKNGSESSKFLLEFLVKGSVQNTDTIISITTDLIYDKDNLLGITLNKLGFKTPYTNPKFDAEGFEVIMINVAEKCDKDFESREQIDLGIEKFLDSIKYNVYLAKMNNIDKGKDKTFWEIDVSSIKLFKVFDGTNTIPFY